MRPANSKHTDKNLENDTHSLKITHPFHPDKGRIFKHLGQSKYGLDDYVSYFDDRGKVRKVPRNITNLHIADIDESVDGDGCVASVENLLSLKELINAISEHHQM